ncbi:MAG: 2OG-Fe(II) oxygenase family protein [Candidatus Woesearchaeota archaeon]
MNWMNPKHEAEALAKKYQEATPYPHLQLPEFLTQKRFKALVEALSQEEFIHKESDLFSLAQTNNLQTSKNETIQEFISFMNSKETRKWFKTLTGVATTPGEIEVFGALYQDTDYLLCHDDQLEERKLAWILYLTTLDTEQGGGLALYTDNNGPEKKVLAYQPEANSLALFTVSPQSWHEVEEVTDKIYRVSIGGWLL